MIVKDNSEAEMLRRCLNTVRPFVDGLFITTTKRPDDEIKNICRHYEGQHSFYPWNDNFADARNFSFSQIPKEYDWIFWIDTDDILRHGENLRIIADEALAKSAESVFFNYIYQAELDKKGNIKSILIEHLRERLVRNNGAYKWVAPIHETLIEQRPTLKIDDERCDILHLSTFERMNEAIRRNIRILEKEIERTKRTDPRPIYYLGKAYFDLRTDEYYDEAIPLFEEYLEKSGWGEERSQAWEYLAEVYRLRGQYNKAIKACANALIEEPKFPSIYLNFALTYLLQKNWDKALFWVKLAAKIPQPKTTLVTNPRDLQSRTLEIIYHAALNTAQLDQSWAAAIKLAELFPENKEINERVNFTTSLRKQKELTKAVIELARSLKKENQIDKLRLLASAVPAEIANNPFIIDLKKQLIPPRDWEENEIALLCGPGFEPWSPGNMQNWKRLAGSEEAVVHITQELAKLGWKVTVFGEPDKEAEYDGAWYRPHYKFNFSDNFNILVVWRNIGFFQNNFSAKKAYLWLHDIANPLEYTQDRFNKITKIMPLSEWHRNNLPNVPDEKFMITANGFTTPKKLPEVKRNPHRMIYTSSYDRGLEYLLAMWPKIKNKIPDAELHVFYGWGLFEEFYKNNPERMAWKAKMENLMVQDGIFHHGKVSQEQIIEEYLKSGIWAYPTHFGEISCISAMKAQAYGAIPVVVDYAALKETVKYGIKVKGDIFDNEIKEKYCEQLIWGLKHQNWQEKERKKMMEWAQQKFTWKRIARQWNREFRSNWAKSRKEAKKK